MKKHIAIKIILFVMVISAAGICENDNKPQILNIKANPALAGLERLYIVLDQHQRIITSSVLPAFIDKLSAKFKQAGLTVVAGVDSVDIERDPNVPEMIIYIDTVYLGNNKAVVLVELSFAAKARLEKPDSYVKSQVWQAKPALGLIDKSKLKEHIESSILKEVDNFIYECLYSRENTKITEAVKPSKLSENKQQQTSADEKSEYPFVASRNSRIYHKSDCTTAKRITPTNLIRLKTKEEAEQSGRRPCQRCKP